jgi:hypothetical protein
MATAVNIEVNVDQNGVVSGLGGVKSALNDMAASAEQMAARINAANERVIATFGAVAKAPKAVQESLQFLNSGAAQMEANFSQVAQEVDAVNAKLDQLQPAADKAAYSILQARIAAVGLGQEIGVTLPRSVSTLIARNEALGPAFDAAFKVIGAVAMGEVIAQVTERVVKLYNDTFVYTDAAKAQYAALIKGNSDLQAIEQKTHEMRIEHFTNTHSGIENAKRDLADNANQYKLLQQQIAATETQIKSLQAVQNQTEVITRSSKSGVQQETVLSPAAQQAQSEIAALTPILANQKAQLTELAAQADLYRDHLVDAQTKAADATEKLNQKLFGSSQIIFDATDHFTQRRIDDEQRADDAIAKAREGADKAFQEMMLHEQEQAARTADAVAQLDIQATDARTKAWEDSLPKWQRINAGIAADYQKTILKLDLDEREFFEKHKNLTEDQMTQVENAFNSERVSAAQEANDKIVQEHRQMVDKLASQLQTFFDDAFNGKLADFALNLFKQFISKLLAEWILGMQQMGGATQGGFGSILHSIFGGGKGGGGGGLFGLPGIGTPGSPGSFFSPSSTQTSIGADATQGVGIGSATAAAGAFGVGGPLAAASASSGLGVGSSLVNAINNSPLAALGNAIASSPIFMNPAQSIGPISGGAALGGGLMASLLGATLGYSTGNPVLGGILGAGGGALAGFEIGSMIGTEAFPVLGTAIGAAIGGLIGIFSSIFGGNARKKQARNLMNQTYLPDVAKIFDAYEGYQEQFSQAMTDITSVEQQAQKDIGRYSKGIYNNEFYPQAEKVRAEIQEIEKHRQQRNAVSFAPAEFHDGGEVPAILQAGEFVVNRAATQRHRGLLHSINGGGASGGGDTHNYIYAIDSKSFEEFLMRRGGLDTVINGMSWRARGRA